MKGTKTLNKPDYTTFGGVVYNYDFEGYVSIYDMISRIASDLRFDDRCKKNIEHMERKRRKVTNGN